METKDVTQKPLIGTLIGVGVFVAVVGLAFWAASKGWNAGKKAA